MRGTGGRLREQRQSEDLGTALLLKLGKGFSYRRLTVSHADFRVVRKTRLGKAIVEGVALRKRFYQEGRPCRRPNGPIARRSFLRTLARYDAMQNR